MLIDKITAGELSANCYLIACEKQKEAVLIDPGAEAGRILERTEKSGCRVKRIIATHGHIDHTGAAAELLEKITPSPLLCIHPNDAAMLQDSEANLAGFAGIPFSPLKAHAEIEDGDIIKAGDIQLAVVHTPGHTPGGICLLGEEALFTGDTLFAGGIGRTDLPGGSHEELLKSIKDRILSMDERIKIYPGHGPESTVGAEKRSFCEWI